MQRLLSIVRTCDPEKVMGGCLIRIIPVATFRLTKDYLNRADITMISLYNEWDNREITSIDDDHTRTMEEKK